MGDYGSAAALAAFISLIVGAIVAVPAYLGFYKHKIKGWLNDRRKNKKSVR